MTSGVTEMESIPHRTSCSAYSGWTDGACPQMEQVIPSRLHSAMMRRIASSTARSRSS